MARVQGVQEKVHLPIYDSIKVEAGKQLGDNEKSSTLKFFVDVQSKTKLETNLQSASLLPHYNTFEARAMRVVIGDSPAKFPETPEVTDSALEVTDDNLQPFVFDSLNSRLAIVRRTAAAPVAGDVVAAETGFDATVAANLTRRIEANITLGLDLLIDLIREARDSEDGEAILLPDDEGVELLAAGAALSEDVAIRIAELGGSIALPLSWLEEYLDDLDEDAAPLEEQIESEQRRRHLDRVARLQHGDQPVCGREADDADADVLFPGRRGTVFRIRWVHDAWRAVALGHVPFRRARLHR